MKTILYIIFKYTYGIRGSIKPPLGGTPFYHIRYDIWRIISRLYDYSGLPETWQKWRYGNKE